MDDDAIISGLEEIFQDLFMDDDIKLSDSTTAADVPGWDSLSHINLIVSVESRFRVKFSQREAAGFRNIGDLVAGISQRQARR